VAVRSFEPVASLAELLARSKAFGRSGPDSPADRAGKLRDGPEAQAIGHMPAEGWGAIGAECGWLARQLKTSGKRLIGLLPASPRTDVMGLAATVGGALTMIVHDVVILVDPDQRSAAGALPTEGAVACSFASGRLVTVLPVERARDGTRLQAMKALLEFVGTSSDEVSQVLVDLSSFALPGELLGVIGMVEGIVIVGSAGRVTDAELLSASSRVPPEVNMGVVLTD
jgi:hypothetical protein